MGLAKRRRGGQTYPEQSNDEQAVSESSLNKLVGAAEVYDLKVNTFGTDIFIIKFTVLISEQIITKTVYLFYSCSLHKIFQETEPPSTLTCELRPYQKQALYWMSELEKGIDVEQAAKTLHPCWDAYNISDRHAQIFFSYLRAVPTKIMCCY